MPKVTSGRFFARAENGRSVDGTATAAAGKRLSHRKRRDPFPRSQPLSLAAFFSFSLAMMARSTRRFC
jgi:hypothetical protein